MLSAPRTRTRLLIAVLLLTAGSVAQTSIDERIAAALDRARPVMLTMSENTAGGVHALLCLAMADDGLTMDDPGFAAAIKKLARARLTNTYDLSCRLMVMAKLSDYPHRRSAAKKDLATLLRNQTGGGFTYRSKGGHWDLSNTQYAALGMRAAASLGARVAKTRWTKLAHAVLVAQIRGEGFGYRPRSPSTPSMTVAGIAVLEICRQQINGSSALARKLEKAVRAAWGHMMGKKNTIGAGAGQQRNYYYHYGLERAAILSDKHRVDDVDWYLAGARMFLDQESKSGGWGWASAAMRIANGAPQPFRIRQAPITTAFAVLFLRRGFRKTLTGPITPSRQDYVRLLPAQASEARITATVKAEIGRGYRAVPDLILAMRSPILARRKVAAKALPAITQRFRSYSPYRQPAESAALIKAAESWWLHEGHKKLE